MRTVLTRNLWLQALLVTLLCAAVYWPLLGRGGLAMSEGHRVVPAWEMLDSGDWLTPTMFGRPYLRKPPGMSWAVAASSMIFGQTEFAARAVSALAATMMALVAWRVATSWFGSPWGLAAGLAQALMPQMWESGRSAEIEALNNLGTQAAALAALGIVLRARTAPARERVALGGVLAAGLVVMALAKGPAGAPVVGGAIAAGAIVRRAMRPLAHWELWAGLGVGLAVAGGAMLAVWRSAQGDGGDIVLEIAGAHMWRADDLLGVVLLAPTAWVWALPASLAMVFVWGPDARREAGASEADGACRAHAMGVVAAWLVALAIYTALGISNPRYAAPAATLLPLCVAYAARGAIREGAFVPRRRAIARAMLPSRGVVWIVALVVGAWVYIGTREAGVRATSGREAGLGMARVLGEGLDSGRITPGATLAADDAIEARPETLAYARRGLWRLGHGEDVQFRWVVGNWVNLNPGPGGLCVVRLDPGSGEAGFGSRLEAGAGVAPLGRFDVHKYTFGLYLSARPASGGEG